MKIIKSNVEIEEVAKYLQTTLISADFLSPKSTSEIRVTSWESIQEDKTVPELPDPTIDRTNLE